MSAIPALGVLLAGGRGQRMGGQDKGLLTWRGRPLAAWVLEALRPQVQAVAINCNRHADAYAALGAPVFADADPQAFGGPLAGLLAGLRRGEAEGWDWVWLAPCDSPQLPSDLAARLWQARGDAPAVLPVGPDGHPQPTHALVRCRLAGALARHLAGAGPHGAAHWLRSQGAVALAVPEPLQGFNTPEALHAAR